MTAEITPGEERTSKGQSTLIYKIGDQTFVVGSHDKDLFEEKYNIRGSSMSETGRFVVTDEGTFIKSADTD